MAKESLITPEFVRATIDYDPATGRMVWKWRETDCGAGWNKRCAGKEAGCVNALGYTQLSLRNVKILGHRAAFCHYHGRWPKGRLDHKDGDRTNNRIDNLREATDSENAFNKRLMSNNKSGHAGVWWIDRVKKFHVYITVNRKRINLGYVADYDEACALRRAAAYKYFGEFSPHRSGNDNE
jgi:hypothetical protein